jgi:hypothetical protein
MPSCCRYSWLIKAASPGGKRWPPRSSIVELRGSLTAIGYCNSLTEDPGMKATINRHLEIRTKALAGLVDLQTACASQDTALAGKALIQIEENRNANRGVLRAEDCQDQSNRV